MRPNNYLPPWQTFKTSHPHLDTDSPFCPPRLVLFPVGWGLVLRFAPQAEPEA